MRADTTSILSYDRDDAEEWPRTWSGDTRDHLGFVLAGVPMPGPWSRLGRCRGAPSEVFFIARGESPAAARAICRSCPVREECREYAIPHRDLQGVWGGTTPRERERLRVERAAAVQPAPAPSADIGTARAQSVPGALLAVLEQLTAHPGQWARVGQYVAPGSAHTTASLLRTGRRPLPPGEWEFEGRRVDGGGSALWARYTPVAEEAAS